MSQDSEAVKKVFGLEVGFFWETVETDETVHEQYFSGDLDLDTQNTMSLVYKKVFRTPCAMMGILNRVLQEGLDLAGIRLLYPTPELMDIASGRVTSSSADRKSPPPPLEMLNTIGPLLALSLRGTFARSIWLDAVGPSDPALARSTDPNSLCALYGGESRDESLIFCPRNPARVNTELCRWFGGRVPPSGVINTGAYRAAAASSTQVRTAPQRRHQHRCVSHGIGVINTGAYRDAAASSIQVGTAQRRHQQRCVPRRSSVNTGTYRPAASSAQVRLRKCVFVFHQKTV